MRTSFEATASGVFGIDHGGLHLGVHSKKGETWAVLEDESIGYTDGLGESG